MKPSILSEPVFNAWHILIALVNTFALVVSTEVWQTISLLTLFALVYFLAVCVSDEYESSNRRCSDSDLLPMNAEEYNYYKNL